MKDILDREIKDGDFVIVKPTGRDSHGLHLGVIVGSSVMLRRYDWDPYIAKYNQYYLVENPTQLEIDYIDKMKQDYQKALEREEKEKDDKKKNIIKKKDIVVGQYYDRGIYLGKIEIKESYGDIKSGIYDNCFVDFGRMNGRSYLGNFGKIYNCRTESAISSTKTFPKVYPREDWQDTATLDEIVNLLKSERKIRKSTRRLFVPYIPNMVLLDLGIEI